MKIIPSILSLCALALHITISNAAEVQQSQVDGEPFVARFYTQEGSTNKPGILYLGGSEGGIPSPNPFLAESGYPVLALAYFKEKGLPKTLQMIPLEYFDRPIEWMRKNPAIKRNGIIVIGGSKGAELALLLASRKREINGVVALSPSSVVWDGIPKSFWPPQPLSSWSVGGKPVPFVPYDYSQPFAAEDPKAIFKFYQQSLKQTAAVEKATIPVEKIGGPVLLASGTDDQLWPSEFMADALCKRFKEKGFAHRYEHLKYTEAGHTLNEYFMMGGTSEGNRKARLDLADQMLRFIRTVETPAAQLSK